MHRVELSIVENLSGLRGIILTCFEIAQFRERIKHFVVFIHVPDFVPNELFVFTAVAIPHLNGHCHMTVHDSYPTFLPGFRDPVAAGFFLIF